MYKLSSKIIRWMIFDGRNDFQIFETLIPNCAWCCQNKPQLPASAGRVLTYFSIDSALCPYRFFYFICFWDGSPLDTTSFLKKSKLKTCFQLPKTLVLLCRNFFVPTSECVNASERRVLKLLFYTKLKRDIVPSFKLVQAEPAGNCNKQMAGGICKIIQCTN